MRGHALIVLHRCIVSQVAFTFDPRKRRILTKQALLCYKKRLKMLEGASGAEADGMAEVTDEKPKPNKKKSAHRPKAPAKKLK